MVYLRDFTEKEIEDEVRWMTLETGWMKADTPWEECPSDNPDDIRNEMRDIVASGLDDFVKYRKEIFADERHIGLVTLYDLDLSEYQGTFEKDDPVVIGVGIEICEPDCRGQGYGTEALKKWLGYCFEHGLKKVFLETWSGNNAMLKCAEKCGFAVVGRIPNAHLVDGKEVDSLLLQFKASDESEAQWYMGKNYDEKMPTYKKVMLGLAAVAIILFIVAAIKLF